MGKLYHLLLTKKERADIIQLIDNAFGPKLEDKRGLGDQIRTDDAPVQISR
jgi:hypothetical protein